MSVRKEELLSDGLTGIIFVLVSLIETFYKNEYLLSIIMGSYLIASVFLYISKVKRKQEPWDEFTRENYGKARKVTLACIEIGTLLGCAIFIVLPFNIAITSELLFLIYGTIKIIQTGAFLYYDMH